MSVIKSLHEVEDDGEPLAPNNRATPSWSSYSYLFPDPADAQDVGCFTGTDEMGTIERLKAFEKAFHPGNYTFAPLGQTFDLPAAYTYFGQFVNHDISAPKGGLLLSPQDRPPGIIGAADLLGIGKLGRAKDVDTILQHFVNQHAQPLSLASLYSDGPNSDDQEVRALYTPDGSFRLVKAYRLPPDILAERTKLGALTKYPADALDIPRAPDIPRDVQLPLIADRRNDGNLILSQLHLAFLIFHNKAVEVLKAKGTKAEHVFEKARELVTLHYHWLILNDFLPALLSKTVLVGPLSEWNPRKMPLRTVPMEFTTAAFRFGHSMVGRSYDFNANFGRGGVIAHEATLSDLLNFTSKGGMGDPQGRIPQLPDHWVIDWDRLTRTQPPGDTGGATGQAERIDLDFAPEMFNLSAGPQTDEHNSIFLRNLLRGFHRRIPFGQQLAKACGVPVLSPKDLSAAMPSKAAPSGDHPADVASALGILDQTPAWVYFLCEAKLQRDGEEGGTRIGTTASHIIADTIVSLMRGQSSAVLSNGGKAWHPRDSLLKAPSDKPLDNLRSFLLFASNGTWST
jgi:Animal haem peroxidase